MARLGNSKFQVVDKICLLFAVLTIFIPFAAHGQTKKVEISSNSALSISTRPNSIHNAPVPPIFLAPVFYGTGGFLPSLVTVADVNGDGKPDVIVANDSLSQICIQNNCLEGAVGVLIGNGDGTFQPPVTYDSGGFGNASVAVRDVNGDGKADLIVANAGSSGTGPGGVIGVLFGHGDGTFQPPVLYDSGGYGASSVTVGDVNGDSKPDIVVANWSGVSGVNGSLGVLLGNGDGTFQQAVLYDTGGVAAKVVVIAEVNGDGKPDLLVANCECQTDSGEIGVLLGKGDGTFQPVVTYVAGPFPWSVAVADLNRDGKPDIAVGSLEGDTVTVLLGNRDGSFRPPAMYNSGVRETQAVAVADVNGDGKPDLVAGGLCSSDTCNLQSAVSVLVGNGDGTFHPAVTFVAGQPDSYWVASLATADLNGDGKPDVVAALSNGGASPGPLSVLLNNTPFCTTLPVITLSTNPRSLWPPNGRLASVTVSGTISESAGCTVNAKTTAYAVTDEYGLIQPTGGIILGAGGTYSFTVPLQASRLGKDLDGRQYTITVRATDNVGNIGLASAVVTVPHDQRH